MFLNLFKKPPKIKPTVLVILDGFGVAPPSSGNAINLAKKPNYDLLLKNFPNGLLIASGESVGLPANEVGNTEVGHLTIGAGRTVLQDLKKINLSIETGSYYENKAFLSAVNSAKEKGTNLHIMGLVSSGNVHSSLEHLLSLIQFCKKEELKRVFYHLFTDGRDAPPKEGIEIIQRVEEKIRITGIGQIASVTGRFYAMDRDSRWDRTLRTYNALVSGQAIQMPTAQDAVVGAYGRGQSDEFIEPTLIAKEAGPVGLIKDGDSIIFFNYRIDRPRQLTQAFVLPEFPQRSKVLKNLYFVTMTEYQKNLPVSGIAFPTEKIEMPLSEVLSSRELAQLHMAESEKERFVNYYFDGIREEKVPGEDSVIVPSPRIPTYDKKPEMSLPGLIKEFKKQIGKDKYHFAVINFANADMVAHSGNLDATTKAITYIDKYLYELVEFILNRDGTVIVTADHGNAEELVTFPTSSFFFTTSKGTMNTDHSNNPVPIIIINKKYQGNPFTFTQGSLPDVAPTVLALMGIRKPELMTGRNLLENHG